jgi:hypothetical protein
VNGQDYCIKHGESGNKFYIILKGVVSVQIPNPNLKDRALCERDFNNIKKWMKEHFEPRIAAAKEDQFEKY